MGKFKMLLEEFDNVLKEFNQFNYNQLQPPLADKEIERYLKSIDIEDEDVFSLYKWKNGIANGTGNSMIFKFETTMLSLENVVKFKNSNNLEIENPNGFIMLFDNEEDCFLFNTNRGKDYGKLHLYSVPLLSIENPLPYFDSLSTMFETTILQYKKKALVYNIEEKFLDSNNDIGIEIYQSLNPLSDFYNNDD